MPPKEHSFIFQIINWDPIRFNPNENLDFAKWSFDYPNMAQLCQIIEFHPAQFVIIFIYRPLVRCFLFVDIEAFAKSVKVRTILSFKGKH